MKEFSTIQEAMKEAETVYYDDLAQGNPVYMYKTGNKKTGYRYVVTNDETKRPKGWRLVEF